MNTMVGSFSGLNTALSALRHQQIAMDVVGHNVSNVNTEGYVRRTAVAAQVGGTGETALYATYQGHGDGVKTEGVQRIFDALIDSRLRRETGKQSYLNTTQAILHRVESAINEPGIYGLSKAVTDFNASLQDLTSDPAGQAARRSVVAKADALATALRTQSDNVTGEAADQRARAEVVVGQINSSAAQLAELNKNIFNAEANGTDAGLLHDQRDKVALALASKVGGVVSVAGDGRYNVAVPNPGGTPTSLELVRGDSSSTMAMTTAANGSISFDIGGAALSTIQGAISGQLGGVADVVNVTLASHKASLDTLATTLMTQINAANAGGKDLNGDAGGALLEFADPTDPAGSLRVRAAVAADPKLIAASGNVAAGLPGGPIGTNTNGGGPDRDGSNADAMSIATSITSDYAALVTSFGAKVAAVNSQVVSQTALTRQVSAEQQQLIGVNLDEETVNLVSAQHAYSAASKVIQTLDSILATLINMKR